MKKKPRPDRVSEEDEELSPALKKELKRRIADAENAVNKKGDVGNRLAIFKGAANMEKYFKMF